MSSKPKDESGGAANGAAEREVDAVEAEAVSGAEKVHAADPNAEDATVLSESGPAQAEEAPEGAGEDAPEGARDYPDQDLAQEIDEEREAGLEEEALAEEGAEASEPPRAERRSGGAALLYALLGAVAGGAISLGGAQLLSRGAVPQEEIATKALVSSALEERLSALEKALRAELDQAQAQANALKAEIASAEAAQAKTADAAADARAALAKSQTTLKDEISVERSRVTKLNDELVARERERAAAVSTMREQVSALAAAVAATPTAGLATGDGDGAGTLATAGSAARLAILEGGLRRIEARVNGLSAEALPVPDLTRIDKLETADRETDARIAALSERLDQVEQEARSSVKGDAAIGVAFAALAEAVAGSAPYAAPLETLKKVADIESVDPALSGPAETGLLSKAALASRFDAAATRALRAAARARAAKGEGGVADRLTGLFTLRRVAEPGAEAMDDDAVLARAQARTEEGDVAAALQELEALPTAAREAMGDWIEAAERRAAAEAALEALRAKLLGIE